MIQLNNLTEVNTAMTELSDRQTGNIKGGAVNPALADRYLKAWNQYQGKAIGIYTSEKYLQILSVQG
jgi:hypothetical protein